jgi:hypothetical protein
MVTNPLSRRQKTMGELLSELRSRLGFIAQGSSSMANDQILISFLQEAAEIVVADLGIPFFKRLTTIQVVKGSKLYDWHDDENDEDINPQDVRALYIADGVDQRYRLIEGITEGMRADIQQSMPSHFDRTGGQIELWPVPERDYGLVVEWDSTHYKFTEKTDRCPVSSRLIFLRALATAKAHYRMPDAQQTAASYNELLSYERGRNVTDKRYSLSNKRSDGGYQVAVGADGTFFAKRY